MAIAKKRKGNLPAAKTRRAAGRSNATDGLTVLSVEKAFRVLECFKADSQSLSLTQIANLTDLDKSAAQRFTHTLTNLGYLRKDPDTKRFELTPRTLNIGYVYTRTNTLVKRAMPYLLHLSKETGETVNLTFLDDTDIVFVARFLSRHVLNTDVTIGSRMPAYCTAPGRAILAFLPDQERNAILDRSHLSAITPHTIWKREEIVTALEKCRKDGYATAFEEVFAGDASVAAPVRNMEGRVLAAVNIATSTTRFTPAEVVKKFAPLAVAAARAIADA